MLTHRQRLIALLEGRNTDRPGFALWRHFPVDDQDPEELAVSTLEFQARYDFDLIKVTPASSFCVRDWGARDDWKGNPEGTRDYQQPALADASAFQSLKPLPIQAGGLTEQLRCLELILNNREPHTPVIQTIFSPLAQAKNLAGKAHLVDLLRAYPQELLDGLETITETTRAFITTCIRLGVDGFFFAEQHAQPELLTAVEFETFARPFAHRLLSTASGTWLNILHVHGDQIAFERVLDYPNVQVLNWHDRKTPPSLVQGSALSGKVVCGGLRQWETMAYGNPGAVTLEAEDAIAQMAGRPFILGTGCVLPIISPASNLRAAKSAVEKAAQL